MVQRNVPLAQQAALQLLAEIDSGTIVRPDGLLPSEAELVQRFGVSRATIREALAKLVTAGIVVRRQGIGTYVNRLRSQRHATVHFDFDRPLGFMDIVYSACGDAQVRVLTRRIGSAQEYAASLAIEPDTQMIIVEKLFLAAGIPLIHSVNVVPYHLVKAECRETIEGDYAFSESVYDFLKEKCGVVVDHQQTQVRAIAADAQCAGLLHCDMCEALLWIEETGYTVDFAPVFHAINYFRGDSVSLSLERVPNFNITQPAAVSCPTGPQQGG